MPKWYQGNYRRNLIDMHITDWDERFLSQFDPVKYADTVCLAQPTAAMVYAHSHVGHSYYPTKVGHQHASLNGRNIFGEVVDQFHQRGVDVIAYFSLIFDDYIYRKHPEWRIILANGEGAADRRRYGVCCPNAPYRDYAAAHVAELCQAVPFEGIFLDMTFWPAICYCPHCQQRYAEEVGGPLPRVIHWEDPAWVSFQRKREEWLTDFAWHLTNTIREAAPGVSIQHQASTYLSTWRMGVTEKLAEANDYLGGDFYGDALEGSIIRKLFANLSPNLPQEFMTSFSINLRNHTAKKPRELLKAKACACLADATAFLFIDAIDPVGTINPVTYERMNTVFEETKVYEPFVGGRPVQDVAIYLSTRSKCNLADNGKAVDDPGLSSTIPHIEGLRNVAKALIENHVPYGVISRNNLADLSRYQAVILPDLLSLDAEEAEALRAYVQAGGSLYASKHTGLIRRDGTRLADFMLADVFGVSYVGETNEAFTYMAPADEGANPLEGYSKPWPLGVDQTQYMLRAHEGAEVLAHLVLPYTDPADGRRYASIHSNPPGIHTGYPALVLNRFGKGKAIYAAAPLEAYEIHRDTLMNLLRLLAGPFTVEADAPGAVEVTTLDQADNSRLVISLVNFQKELPNIPVEGARVRVRLHGRRPGKLLLLPGEAEHPYEREGDVVAFAVPTLETLQMFALHYS